MEIQLKYQRELEKLEKDNRDLRKRLILAGNTVNSKKKTKVNGNL